MTEAAKLSPAVLAERLDRILEATERLLREIPTESMDWTPPERNRPLRDLGFHVFRLSLAFVDAMDSGKLPEEWFQEKAPAEMTDGRAIASYGALVGARLSGWFQGADTSEYARVVEVYYGLQAGHDLLERTAWHAAQHLRQLYVLAERLGVTPSRPLPVAAFEGLPLPAAVW